MTYPRHALAQARRLALPILLCSALVCVRAAPVRFNIPAQSGSAAVALFIEQSNLPVMFNRDDLNVVRTKAVAGELEPEAALRQMLEGTGYSARPNGSGKFVIGRSDQPRSDPNDPRAAQASDRPTKSEKAEENPTTLEAVRVLGKFEVMDSKLLNMDLPRSRDEVQPYVIFEPKEIQRSGAISVEDFLKSRLPMNAVATTASQDGANRTAPTRTSYNLRGLGLSQTLILVDGRRLPLTFGASYLQSDTTSIPMSAVERIEVLPTTSSGIYGGSATGGVINIILRRDYTGVEVKLSYDNSFRTDSATRRIDISGGFSLEGGKTNVILTLSHSDGHVLRAQDRPFNDRLVRHLLDVSQGNLSALDLFQVYPPLGATTNIRSATGSPLTLKNGTPLNSAITYVPPGYNGAASDGAAALLANAGKYNLGPSNAITYFRGTSLGPLLAPPDRDSLMAMVRRQFLPNLQVFAEFAAGNVKSIEYGTSASGVYTLPATAPTNPFAQSINLTVPFYRPDDRGVAWDQSRRVAVGAIAKLPASWLAEIDYTWGTYHHAFQGPPQPFASFGTQVTTGAVDALRDSFRLTDLTPVLYSSYLYSIEPYRNDSNDVALRLSGPVGTLPGGTPTVAALLGYHDDVAPHTFTNLQGTKNFIARRSQTARSAYVEARLPLLGGERHWRFVQAFEVQLAGRTDRYRVNGAPSTALATAAIPRASNVDTATSPTAGIRYKVTGDLTLRASYSEGFLPPNFNQLTSTFSPASFSASLRDPRRGNESVPTFTTISGGNADLKPEKSTSESVGVILTPRFLPGLRLSVDWTLIKKRDNLTTLSFQNVLNNEIYLPARVIRGPNLPTDPSGWAGPVTALNVGYSNIARAEMEAYDLRADYTRRLQGGSELAAYVAGSWEPHLKTQLVPTSPVVENVGTGVAFGVAAPLHFKGNAGLTWTRGPLTVGWETQYYGAYVVTSVTLDSTLLRQLQGNGGRVEPQMFHDVFATYRFDRVGRHALSWLRSTELTAGIKNVFNTLPTPVLDPNESTTYNTYVDPRLAVYFLSVKRTF